MYQLVLQWPASQFATYDRIIEIEELLIAALTAERIDGHDIGAGEFNIFIQTNDPRRSFDLSKSLLDGHGLWGDARAAYRELRSSRYYILWPPDLAEFKVK
jgi:hypothetical protein